MTFNKSSRSALDISVVVRESHFVGNQIFQLTRLCTRHGQNMKFCETQLGGTTDEKLMAEMLIEVIQLMRRRRTLRKAFMTSYKRDKNHIFIFWPLHYLTAICKIIYFWWLSYLAWKVIQMH